ncbi:MAG: hypothetical protein IPG96_02115 [Proteobacteria bacterium]|nr:hypothetical protein [Pseudomonadota bacterium]
MSNNASTFTGTRSIIGDALPDGAIRRRKEPLDARFHRRPLGVGHRTVHGYLHVGHGSIEQGAAWSPSLGSEARIARS